MSYTQVCLDKTSYTSICFKTYFQGFLINNVFFILEIGLFVGGILVTLTMIILIIKSIIKLKRPKRAWEEDESNNFIEQTAKSSDEKEGGENRPKIFMREHNFHLPLSYEKIQNQKPWKHRAVPTVSVTQVSFIFVVSCSKYNIPVSLAW